MKSYKAIQEDLHAMTNTANEIIRVFASDTGIFQSASNLAEITENAKKALAKLVSNMERRMGKFN